MGAGRLIDVASAHVDGCLYHGRAGLEFAERLAAGGARVSVPTTLNVGALDLLHPERSRLDPATAARPAGRWTRTSRWAAGRPGRARRTSCRSAPPSGSTSRGPSRTPSSSATRCSARGRTATGTSSTSARPSRAGCRSPGCTGTRTGGRGSSFGSWIVPAGLESDALFPVLGHVLGREASSEVAAVVGLPPGTRGPAEGARGRGGLLGRRRDVPRGRGDARGAPLEAATGGEPAPEIAVTLEMLRAARDELGAAGGSALGAVCVGTPHASLAELERLRDLLRPGRPQVPCG